MKRKISGIIKGIMYKTVLILITLLGIGCSTKPENINNIQESISQTEMSVEQPSRDAELTSEEVVADEGDEDFGDDFDEFEDEFEDAEKTEVYDPLSGYNRFMTNVNDKFAVFVLDPVTDGYKFVVHKEIRGGIGNFFHNLLFPLRFINNILQLKFKNAGEEALRFGINSTVGLLGFGNPAKHAFGLEAHDEDFGQTLGYYGVGSGIHIVLPILGPSNLRDAFSLFPESLIDPISSNNLLGTDKLTGSESLGVTAFKTVNKYSLSPIGYQDLTKDAFDLYLFLRDSYEQNRNKKIEE